MALAIRQPAVAGRFYPRDPKALLADVQSYLSPRQSPTTALGCVVPHAGYMYSGPSPCDHERRSLANSARAGKYRSRAG